MDTTSGEFAVGTGVGGTGIDGSIVRFLDLETLLELVENSCIVFRRWEGDADRAFSRFVRERLPAALLRLSAAEKPHARGKLQRWWAAQERENQLADVIASIRALPIPPVAWIDSWYAGADQDPLLWRLQEAAGQVIGIGSTIAALNAALQPRPAETVIVGAVDYGPAAATAGGAGSIDTRMVSALNGDPTLAYEREVRAVVSVGEAEAPAADHAVAVAPERLVQSVWLAPTTTDRKLALVRRLLDRAGLRVPCRRIAFGDATRDAADAEVPLITHQPSVAEGA
ncbi:hypothetical protein DF3PB_3220005 [uncultured Defluviicoccus sp.]|uniref:Uncharacterized protein n=1 Tax=metagenome TaxID=256318 RepID=A0A380TGA2_9ZZZZ|nr:hypothetical protein DF3PB_3220005 [uncultured Defluviicoccus sp.]